MDLEKTKQQINENWQKAEYLSRWKNLETGKICKVKTHVILEATLEPSIVYYEEYDDPWKTWCIPASEFFDGRFEEIPSEIVIEAFNRHG